MVTNELPTREHGPRPGEDWRAHRIRVFADYPEILEVLRIAESREHEAEIWRERNLAAHEGDPEMQEFIREAQFDLESTPEEDEEDIRICRERAANGITHSYEDVMRRLAAEFPDEAEELLSGL